MIPYWLEVTLVIILFVGGFLFIVWKDGGLKDMFIGIKDFFVKLYEMIFLGIEDRETYDKNKEEREKNEEYIRNMKSKKD